MRRFKRIVVGGAIVVAAVVVLVLVRCLDCELLVLESQGRQTTGHSV